MRTYAIICPRINCEVDSQKASNKSQAVRLFCERTKRANTHLFEALTARELDKFYGRHSDLKREIVLIDMSMEDADCNLYPATIIVTFTKSHGIAHIRRWYVVYRNETPELHGNEERIQAKEAMREYFTDVEFN